MTKTKKTVAPTCKADVRRRLRKSHPECDPGTLQNLTEMHWADHEIRGILRRLAQALPHGVDGCVEVLEVLLDDARAHVAFERPLRTRRESA